MKKIFKNKKGFTLVELLAVIVILAIIMVIATQQIGKVIQGARADSFVESYQMIAKQVNTYIASDQLDAITCDDTDSDTTNNCSSKYGLSSADYSLKVEGNSGTYTVTLSPSGDTNGKFANMDLTKNGKAANSGTCEHTKIANGATSCTAQQIVGTVN